jgi:hypothetical protein
VSPLVAAATAIRGTLSSPWDLQMEAFETPAARAPQATEVPPSPGSEERPQVASRGAVA